MNRTTVVALLLLLLLPTAVEAQPENHHSESSSHDPSVPLDDFERCYPIAPNTEDRIVEWSEIEDSTEKTKDLKARIQSPEKKLIENIRFTVRSGNLELIQRLIGEFPQFKKLLIASITDEDLDFLEEKEKSPSWERQGVGACREDDENNLYYPASMELDEDLCVSYKRVASERVFEKLRTILFESLTAQLSKISVDFLEFLYETRRLSFSQLSLLIENDYGDLMKYEFVSDYFLFNENSMSQTIEVFNQFGVQNILFLEKVSHEISPDSYSRFGGSSRAFNDIIEMMGQYRHLTFEWFLALKIDELKWLLENRISAAPDELLKLRTLSTKVDIAARVAKSIRYGHFSLEQFKELNHEQKDLFIKIAEDPVLNQFIFESARYTCSEGEYPLMQVIDLNLDELKGAVKWGMTQPSSVSLVDVLNCATWRTWPWSMARFFRCPPTDEAFSSPEPASDDGFRYCSP